MLSSTIDMTALTQMSKSFPGQEKGGSGTLISSSSTNTASDADPCGDSKKNPYLNIVNCTSVNTGIINIAGTVKIMENKWLTIKDGVYVYDLRQIEKILNGNKAENTQT